MSVSLVDLARYVYVTMDNLEEGQSLCNFLSLPTLLVGSRRLRYLYFHPPTSATLECSDNNAAAIPLFLATDVIAGGSISSSNQPRAHARFAKIGLATKLAFQEGVKLYGIHGIAKGVWFYSVQGVMRVAFEHLGKEEQLACMTSLQELWKARYNDPLLKASYSVTLDVEDCNQCSQCTDGSDHTQEVSIPVTEQQHMSTQNVPAVAFSKSVKLQNSYQTQACTVTVRPNVPPSPEKDHSATDIDSSEDKLLEDLSRVVANFSASHAGASSCAIAEILKSVFTVLKLQSRLFGEELNCEQFPWKLLSDYKQGLVVFHGNLNSGCTKDMVYDLSLDIACAWLGREFKSMSASISNSVVKFKADNISCIDNLPPAEELIDTLFPRCMKILFATWIGIKANESHKPVDVPGSASDRASTSTRNMRSQPSHPRQRFSRYPLVQLILEFANQTLISGTAHVLYSRLIQQ